MFELQPTLQGDLVKLQPLLSSDFPHLFAAASDPLIWEQHPASDRYQEPVFRQFFDEGMASGGAFLICEANSDRIIGSSRYCHYSQEDNEIEIGYTFLARDYWGGRFNAEIKALMLQHAFQFVDSVLFVVGNHNFRSQQAVMKLGALPDPTALQLHNDRIIYRLRRDRYLAHGFRYGK